MSSSSSGKKRGYSSGGLDPIKSLKGAKALKGPKPLANPAKLSGKSLKPVKGLSSSKGLASIEGLSAKSKSSVKKQKDFNREDPFGPRDKKVPKRLISNRGLGHTRSQLAKNAERSLFSRRASEQERRKLLGQVNLEARISEDLYTFPFKILPRVSNGGTGRIFIAFGVAYGKVGEKQHMFQPAINSGQVLLSAFNNIVGEAPSFPLKDCSIWVKVKRDGPDVKEVEVVQLTDQPKKKKGETFYLVGEVTATGIVKQFLKSDIFIVDTASSSSSSDSSGSGSGSGSGSSSSSGSDSDGSGDGSGSVKHPGKNAIFKLVAKGRTSYVAAVAEEADRFYLKAYFKKEVCGSFFVKTDVRFAAVTKWVAVQSVVDYSGKGFSVTPGGGGFFITLERTAKKRTVVVVLVGLVKGSQKSFASRTHAQWKANKALYTKLQNPKCRLQEIF